VLFGERIERGRMMKQRCAVALERHGDLRLEGREEADGHAPSLDHRAQHWSWMQSWFTGQSLELLHEPLRLPQRPAAPPEQT